MKNNSIRLIANMDEERLFSNIQSINEIESVLKTYKPFKNEDINFIDTRWEICIQEKRAMFIFEDYGFSNELYSFIKMMLICIAKQTQCSIRTLHTHYEHLRSLAKYLHTINFPYSPLTERTVTDFLYKIEQLPISKRHKHDKANTLIFWKRNNEFLPYFFRLNLPQHLLSFNFSGIEQKLKRGQEGNPAIDPNIFYYLYGQSLKFILKKSQAIIDDYKNQNTADRRTKIKNMLILIGACSIVILSATGIRMGELLALKEDCVIRQNELVYLRFFESKINEQFFLKPINQHIAHAVVIIKEIKALINQKKKINNDFLFGFRFRELKTTAIVLSKSGFRIALNTCLDFFGLKHYKITAHQFRSTFATNAYNQCNNDLLGILMVFYALRHKRLEMSLRYIKTNLESLKKELQQEYKQTHTKRKNYSALLEVNYPYSVDKSFIIERQSELVATPYCMCLCLKSDCFFATHYKTNCFKNLKQSKILYPLHFDDLKCIQLDGKQDEN